MLWREARKRGRHGNGGGTETAEARKIGQGRKMRQGEEGGALAGGGGGGMAEGHMGKAAVGGRMQGEDG